MIARMSHFTRQTLQRALRGTRRLRQRVSHQWSTRAFKQRVLTTTPLPVARRSEIEVRAFFGRQTLLEGIAALKSFYHFAPEAYALVVHEDGSLTRKDAELIFHHFPGARIIPRETADREVIPHLRRLGFERCAELRRQFILAIKFFDLAYYGTGRRLLYMDSDILFLDYPAAVIEALHVSDTEWRDRYALDIHTCYSWPCEVLEQALGIGILPAVNSGLLIFRSSTLNWSVAEDCLALPSPRERGHYREQTLFAVELSRSGALALPPEYDVCFRHTWRDDYERWLVDAATGHEVVSQHYCGSPRQRAHFYRHFVDFVAPQLDVRTPRAERHAVPNRVPESTGTGR